MSGCLRGNARLRHEARFDDRRAVPAKALDTSVMLVAIEMDEAGRDDPEFDRYSGGVQRGRAILSGDTK